MLGDTNWGLNMVGGWVFFVLFFYIEHQLSHMLERFVSCVWVALSHLHWAETRCVISSEKTTSEIIFLWWENKRAQVVLLCSFCLYFCSWDESASFLGFFNRFPLRRIDMRFILTAKWTGFRDEKRKCEMASHPNPHPFCLPQAGKCEQYKT